MSFTTNDFCVGFFLKAWEDGLIQFPPTAKVLEIGAAEGSDWIDQLGCTDVTGIDIRKPSNGRSIIVGDVMTTRAFEPESFDVAVAISTLEHIGLGAYGDPCDPDGDRITVARVGKWLKPGGVFYFDVPYRPDGPYKEHTNYRAYDKPNLEKRLLTASPVLVPKHAVVMEASHPDAPYIAVVMRKAA